MFRAITIYIVSLTTVFMASVFVASLMVAQLFFPIDNVAAQEVQVNQADVNLGNNDDSTSQSETNNAVIGSTVVVGWNDSRQFAQTGLAGLTSFGGFGFSENGGASFTDAGLLNAPAGGFINLGDPALAGAGAQIYYAALAARPAVLGLGGPCEVRVSVYPSASITPNVTFGPAVMLDNANPGRFADKEFIAVDTTGGTFNGRVYVAWSEFTPTPPCVASGNTTISFAHSTSTTPLAFASTMVLAPATAFRHGAMPAVGPSGEVYVVWLQFTASGAQEYHIIRSDDGGVTFANPDASDPSPEKIITTAIASPGSLGMRTRGFARLAVDRTAFGSATRGNVYVVYHAQPDSTGTDRASVFFTKSTDQGRTWSRPKAINASPAAVVGNDLTSNDNWMPAIAVSPTSGQITVSFYDRREDPANNRIRVYRAFSTDGGATWSNEPVSTVSFAPSIGYDPLLNAAYMGDYIDAVASATGAHLSWGDTRNTCAPPAGSVAPCSPLGRGDQDVFYNRIADLTGPDLAIRPWGYVTGVGPDWQSPDIFVVDTGGNEINAAKGQLNRLRARVRNVGNAAASGAQIRFSFAPWFVGITPAAFKQIGTAMINFGAAGDSLGTDLQIVPVTWDLTDLTDTNGGAWPSPISAFDHFCVKVDVVLPADVDLANNSAQSNFFDVPTITGQSIASFIVGNPFDHDARARLLLASLPKGYTTTLEGAGIKFGEPFAMKPNELRTVTMKISADHEFNKDPPLRDLVAAVELELEGTVVGGISMRLARGSEEPREGQGPLPERRQSYQASYQRVFEAILAVMKQREIPVSLANPERGLINSGGMLLDREKLVKVAGEKAASQIGDNVARFLVSFRVNKIDERVVEVGATAVFLIEGEADPPVGAPLASDGAIERDLLAAVAKLVE